MGKSKGFSLDEFNPAQLRRGETFVRSAQQGELGIRGGVESNRTNFELIFLEFLEQKLYFRINQIEKFLNRTNRIILPSNQIEFRIFSNSIKNFRIFFQGFFQQIADIMNKFRQGKEKPRRRRTPSRILIHVI